MNKTFSYIFIFFFISAINYASENSIYNFTKLRTDSNLTAETVIESYDPLKLDQFHTEITTVSIINPININRRKRPRQYIDHQDQVKCCFIIKETTSILENDFYNICLKCDCSCCDQSIHQPKNVHPHIRRSRNCIRHGCLPICCIISTVIAIPLL